MTCANTPLCSQRYYPALDGLRAIAILLVFAVHYASYVGDSPFLTWGWVGVDLFFVLSGFLITGILYDTLHRPDFFRNFYIRRALRIFPLYYAIWLLLFLLQPMVHPQWNRYHLSALTYTANFFMTAGRGSAHPTPSVLEIWNSARTMHRGLQFAPIWSLCVEEQFYLVWPVVVWVVRSRQTLLKTCLGGILLAPVLRCLLLMHYPDAAVGGLLYTSTFTRFDTLLMGSAVALWLRSPDFSVMQMRRVREMLIIVPPLVLALCLLSSANHWKVDNSNPLLDTTGFTLVGLTCVGILLMALDSSRVIRVLTIHPLVALGRLSYGIYLLHDIFHDIFSAGALHLEQRHLYPLVPFAAFALAYGLAWLSFRYLESPFLLLKERLAPRPGAVADPPPDPHAIPAMLPGIELSRSAA